MYGEHWPNFKFIVDSNTYENDPSVGAQMVWATIGFLMPILRGNVPLDQPDNK